MSEGEVPSTVRKGKEAKTRSMRKARGSERMAHVAAGTWGQAGGDTGLPGLGVCSQPRIALLRVPPGSPARLRFFQVQSQTPETSGS